MLSETIELAAFVALDTGAWLLSPVAGLIVLGVLLWIVAQALDGVKLPRPQVKWPRLRPPRVTWPKTPKPGAGET